MDVQQAPQFTLEHIEGHPVSLSDFRGRTVVIALFGRNSADQMGAAVDNLRTHYDAQQLPILVVSDMGGIPRAARIPVRKQLKRNYKEAVESATAQLQAAGQPVPPGHELVFVLPDWDGTVARSFGLAEVGRDAALVLIDAEGNVRGYGRGDQAAEQIMALFG